MATTPKAREGSNLKERKNSAPSSPQSTLSSERRSPRPITPDNHKQALNNVKLKSTIAPVIAPKFTCSPKRLPLQKTTEKSPTPTPKSRTTLPSSPIMVKEGPVRLPYAAPKQFTSLKPSWEKVPKLASSAAKTGQVARAKVVDSRREATVPTADKTKILDPRGGATAPATSTSSSIDSSAVTVDKEALATSTSSAVDSSAVTVNNEALATQEERVQKEVIIESLGIPHIRTSKLEIEQDPVASTPVVEHLVEYPQLQLNSNAEEMTTDDYSMQMEEKKAEATNDHPKQMEEEKGAETSTDSRVEEGSKVDDAKIETKSTRRGQRLPAVEPLKGAAKPTKIRAAMDASKRSAEAVKRETVRSNDVIEEAKSKFLEKRKNKVLALVGAFETVMALQEPEGQQAKAKEAESSSIE